MFCSPLAGPSMTSDHSGVLRAPRAGSDVETEDRCVAILKNVLLALDSHLTQGTRFGPPAGVDQLLPADHVGLDKASLEVAVDYTGSRRRTGATTNRPAATLGLAPGQDR